MALAGARVHACPVHMHAQTHGAGRRCHRYRCAVRTWIQLQQVGSCQMGMAIAAAIARWRLQASADQLGTAQGHTLLGLGNLLAACACGTLNRDLYVCNIYSMHSSRPFSISQVGAGAWAGTSCRCAPAAAAGVSGGIQGGGMEVD
jgi:hypothetical protein